MLRRWSLDQFVLCLGGLALVALYLPTAVGVTRRAAAAADRALCERARPLAELLAAQVVEPLLLNEPGAVHLLLQGATSIDTRLAYVCVTAPDATVVAHTFGAAGIPQGLLPLWRAARDSVTRYRNQAGAVMDVAAPVWQGQLGTVHVGVSRQEAVGASNRMQLWMCAGLGAAVFLVLTGAQLLAAGVSRPLRELDLAVSQFPSRPLHLPPPSRFRTSEIDSLFRAIGAMARRLTGLEQDRAATVQRMVNAERLAALGQLAAGLAHEIHNPLDGMLECLAYLDADPQKSSRAAKYYPMLRDGLQRIAGTMRQMLSFARTGSEATCELSPVTDVVESLSLLVRPKLEGHRVRLIWEGDPGCACECDRNGLSQAGLNLVLNAAEAAENSADPCVRVRTRCDQKWVYLSVEDSGPGVPEALRSRIFEPFFTTRPPGRGTGLGLSVSRETIRACGGEIELAPERSPLGGAVFVIRVPRAADGGRDHGSGSSQNPHR